MEVMESILERLPEALKEGENWELLTLDPEWIWLVEHGDQVVGILIAGPCHGLVFIWRVKVLAGAPHWTLGKLFRRFIRDIRKRGCMGYVSFLDIGNRPQEQAIARIAHRAGAHFMPGLTLAFGSVNAKHVGE